MVSNLSRFFILVALVPFALGSQTANSAGEIGVVRLVKVWAFGTPPQATRGPLFRIDDLFSNELVETVENGALHILFLDDTTLRLGSLSQVTLDSFVYDPNTSSGEMVVDLGEGIFRFITGKMNKNGIQVRTPVAVIGVRGTEFIVEVGPDGTTTVSVIEGAVEVTAREGGGASVSVGVGRAVVVNASLQFSERAALPQLDPGLRADAGISQGGVGGGHEQNVSSPSPSP